MKGEQSVETPVGVPASVVWEAYRGLELGRLVDQLLPDVVGKVQILEGDGGVGTIVKLTFPPGTPGNGYLKEIFREQDDEKRVKVTEVIEGGYKDVGFDVCRICLEIIEKDAESAIVKSTIQYEIDDTKAHLVSFISTNTLEIMAQTVGNYLAHNKSSTPTI
ncbi:norbelladine synthase-like [Euphorbia lathyris]|uniref:norbelladine synthase-like n=1 Tax=Euphorbia lathyris TaxID=212925 RepID=UPI0033135047